MPPNALIAVALLFAQASAPTASPPLPPTTPTPAALEAGLAGRWQGTLGYRDYETNRLEEIPVQTRLEALPDSATIIRVSTFDDGPRVGDVTITTASLFDAAAGGVATATLRQGRPLEARPEQVRVAQFTDAGHWTLVFEGDGTDGDSQARLRTTQVRDGDVLTATKDIQRKGSADWQFRNRSKLTRIP